MHYIITTNSNTVTPILQTCSEIRGHPRSHLWQQRCHDSRLEHFVLCVGFPHQPPHPETKLLPVRGWLALSGALLGKQPSPAHRHDPQVRRSRSPGKPARRLTAAPLRPGPQLSALGPCQQAGFCRAGPLRPPRPIVPDLTLPQRMPAAGRTGALVAEVPGGPEGWVGDGRIHEGELYDFSAGLRAGSRRGAFTLLARQRRPPAAAATPAT